MKKLVIFILITVFIGCKAQKDQKFNLGFEKHSNTNKLSDGWFLWGSYVLNIDSLSHSGQKSGKITSSEDGRFGSIAYKIPANYKGNRIKLEGFMKIENVENGFAGLLLRVDGDGRSLVFDNMQSQNVSGTKDWQKYTIELNYPEGAENIFVAGILTGAGEAWFDDFVLTIDGESVQTLKEREKPVYQADLDKEFDSGSNIEMPELKPDLISDLELLGRIWGFVKYHHPEIAKGNYNWDYELFRFLPGYMSASDSGKKEEMLLNWINDLGKVTECVECLQTDSDAHLKIDLDWIESDIESKVLRDKLQNIYKNRNEGTNYYIKLTSGVGNPGFKNEKRYASMPYPDDGFRLLALFKYWNMINYFFPYKHLTDKDWNSTLEEYIPVFIRAQNELEYEIAAIKIIGEIKDTHANLWGGNNKVEEWKGNYCAPVHLRFIENKLIVTDYYNPEYKDETGLETGDIITRIEGKEVDDIVSEISIYYPASNQPTRLRDIAIDMLRSQKTEIEIKYINNGKLKSKLLKLYPRTSLNLYRWYRRSNEKCYKILDDNIGYITLKSIKDADIPAIKKDFINTKGIIIDIRNYPSTFVPFKLGTFFVTEPTPFVKFTKGNVNNPGEFTFTPNLVLPKPEETYKGKLVVIVNELSQSQAEYTAMAFRAGDNTTIIGSITAGADGNTSPFYLPGGLRTNISGIGVFYPDGTETQRVGIVPDIEAEPTIEGIKNGRDELLEKAIEIILDK